MGYKTGPLFCRILDYNTCWPVEINEVYRMARKATKTVVGYFVLNISHGSVTTHLRCGSIVNDGFITNSLLSRWMKDF